MNTKNLLKEAIADAKAVRETALAQAKLALEEAFAPRLQSMFAARLQEEMDENEVDESYEMEEEDENTHDTHAGMAHENMEEEGNIDEIDLDEILAELDAEMNEKNDQELCEADDAEEAEETEEEEAEEDMEDDEENAKEEAGEEKEVSELSMDELEELIRDIVSQEMGAGDGIEGEDEQGHEDMEAEPGTEEDEVNLDEILAELLGDDDSDVEEDVEENKKEMDEELKLALETVNTLRNELQEVNLLNAKLLYVNKIFKAKNLTESQKLKVIKTFDKAESAKEAKLVYESLSETFTTKPGKSQIKESLGFASKSTGVAPQKQIIVESNDFISRMQKLANIK